MIDLFKIFIPFLKYDMQIAKRKAHTWLTSVLFFLIVIAIAPLTLDNANSLKQLGPCILWLAVLLAILISLVEFFQKDYEEGFIDLWLLSPYPLTLLMFLKVLSHWLTHCLPLILLTPIFGLLFHLTTDETKILFFTFLLGTPIFSLIGGIGAALLVGIRTNGLLLPILIMPLYIPVLIFGTQTVSLASLHVSLIANFAIMGAILLITLAFAPFLIGVALRVGVNQ